jgi:two-component system sensor histidine kinase KdpD
MSDPVRLNTELIEYSRLNRRNLSWDTSERLMVAISANSNSDQLIQAAKHLAKAFEAPWLALHVEAGDDLNDTQREQLQKNLTFAAEMGAEVLSTADVDVARGILQIAQSRNVSQIVLGQTTRNFLAELLSGGSLYHRINRGSRDFDIHLIRLERGDSGSVSLGYFTKLESGLLQYWYTLWIVAAMALCGAVVEQFFGYRAVGFLFLCSVLGLSLFYSLGPVLFCALSSALVWDYFFIPPRFTFSISASEDVMMILAYFLAAVTTGLLTYRVRKNQKVLQERERRTDLLYRLVSAITSEDKEKNLSAVTNILEGAIGRNFSIFLTGRDGKLLNQAYSRQSSQLSDKDLLRANEVLDQKKHLGRTQLNLDSSEMIYAPLIGIRDTLGLLVCSLRGNPPLSMEEEDLFKSAATQIGLALEREGLEEKSRDADLLRESELLHQALLNSISHELRTPLTALLGSAEALQDEATASNPDNFRDLLDEISGAGLRLNRVIENLLDMARLNSGVLSLNKEWHDPAELIRLTVQSLRRPLSGHTIQFEIVDDLPLIHADYRLIEHALSNLLLNASIYAGSASPITVAARVLDGCLEMSVSDFGPGIPAESLTRIFEKFYRVPGSPAGGTGLGLFITQSLVQAHGGQARVSNRRTGGAEFIISLPLENPPALPREAVA